MTIQNIIRKIPNYATDTRNNFKELFTNEIDGLTSHHLYGISLAVCYALKNEQLVNTIRNESRPFFEENHFEAAKSACAIMAMNNTYFEFFEMAADPELSFTPGDLHMDILHNPGIDKLEFEMYLMAVSLVNNCTYCVKFHKDKLVKKGLSKQTIKNIARIASVLKSVAEVLNIENLRTYDFVLRGENF